MSWKWLTLHTTYMTTKQAVQAPLTLDYHVITIVTTTLLNICYHNSVYFASTHNCYYYTSDSLRKIWLVESIQSIHNSLWTWHDKCNICCRYYIMSSSMSSWLPSPLECSPQKQNGWMLRFCFWGWIMWKMYKKTIIEFGFRMISWIIKTSCLCCLPKPKHRQTSVLMISCSTYSTGCHGISPGKPFMKMKVLFFLRNSNRWVHVWRSVLWDVWRSTAKYADRLVVISFTGLQFSIKIVSWLNLSFNQSDCHAPGKLQSEDQSRLFILVELG